jgi:peptide/nickel transport system ATP-binding protein/oligopeptide transport system ATP-binding protein
MSLENEKKVLIQVRNLKKYFPVRGGVFKQVTDWVQAVDDVSFNIHKGETLSLVGESGCGKTTAGRTILNLIKATSGEVIFEEKKVFDLNAKELKVLRREMQIIFQDPFASLDPRVPIANSIGEGLRIHKMGNADQRMEVVLDILRRVGLEEGHARRFPHEFSGGQRQRIGIARALALKPKFIICDEPVSALDVSIQSQVLNLLKELQDDFDLTYLFIAHNLSVVEHISDRVAVMYLGKIVELASRENLFSNPKHPYTEALLSAVPVPKPGLRRNRIILKGDVPSPLNPPSGCRFHTRCPKAMDRCSQSEPALKTLPSGSQVACFLYE